MEILRNLYWNYLIFVGCWWLFYAILIEFSWFYVDNTDVEYSTVICKNFYRYLPLNSHNVLAKICILMKKIAQNVFVCLKIDVKNHYI